jgi:hypothetical protein
MVDVVGDSRRGRGVGRLGERERERTERALFWMLQVNEWHDLVRCAISDVKLIDEINER